MPWIPTLDLARRTGSAGEESLPGPRSPAGIIREILSAPPLVLVMGRCDNREKRRAEGKEEGSLALDESLSSGFGV